jgi:hypothetical protein
MPKTKNDVKRRLAASEILRIAVFGKVIQAEGSVRARV